MFAFVICLCKLHKGLSGFLNSLLYILEFCKVEILKMDYFFGLCHTEQQQRCSRAVGWVHPHNRLVVSRTAL